MIGITKSNRGLVVLLVAIAGLLTGLMCVYDAYETRQLDNIGIVRSIV